MEGEGTRQRLGIFEETFMRKTSKKSACRKGTLHQTQSCFGRVACSEPMIDTDDDFEVNIMFKPAESPISGSCWFTVPEHLWSVNLIAP